MTTVSEEIPPGDWMLSVAELLPVRRFDPRPFTLGEAVAELRIWAKTARIESWTNRRNRHSLKLDIEEGKAALGPRLRTRVEDLMPALDAEGDRQAVAAACSEFLVRWARRDAITDTFRDLCEAAAAGAASWELRRLADILASQTNDTSRGWGVLSEASHALEGDPHEFQIEHWLGKGSTLADLTPTVRLETAERVITTNLATGHVTVWLLYGRAFGPFTFSAGPISIFRTDWAIPNATREDGQDFVHRDELRKLVADHPWLAKEDAPDSPAESSRNVLVRVDLGDRHPTGAAEEATRQVEALISIAVGAGGVSWVFSGTSITLLDGQDRISTFGTSRGSVDPKFEDTYGMRSTTELLEHWATELAPSLETGPMPDFLIEALSAFREARMIDHRDVKFYNERAITPRIATALEDHTIELVASLASTTPEDLVAEFEEQEVEDRADQIILKALMGPIDHNRDSTAERRKAAEAVEGSVVEYSKRTRLVSLSRVWDERERLRSLPTSPTTRATFERGLEAITSTTAEEAIVDQARSTVEVVRARHRRVRNAVTHGNPVTPAALDSVRDFSQHISRAALSLALHSFQTNQPIATLLSENARHRDEAAKNMAKGMSRVERERAAVSQSSQSESTDAP